MRDFLLPKDKTIPLVVVAGGMGITPVHSRIKRLSDKRQKRHLHRNYAGTEEDELAAVSPSKEYGLKFTPIGKQPAGDWQGETGSLSVDRILQMEPDDGRKLYYLSGPEPMVENFVKEFEQKGVAKDRLV